MALFVIVCVCVRVCVVTHFSVIKGHSYTVADLQMGRSSSLWSGGHDGTQYTHTLTHTHTQHERFASSFILLSLGFVFEWDLRKRMWMKHYGGRTYGCVRRMQVNRCRFCYGSPDSSFVFFCAATAAALLLLLLLFRF